MKRSTNKKGFTIVELVIVIAVIAILAAVLIPTFASLVKKANESVDIQAVRQMNTALSIYNAEEQPKDLITAIKALQEQKIELDSYHPLTSDTQFYWVKSQNRIVYADKDKTVLYPEESKNWTYSAGDWFVLDATIEKTTIDYTKAVDTNGTLNIGTAGQLAQFAEDFVEDNAETNAVKKIVLTDNIYLDGAEIFIKNDKVGFEIDGNGKTIYGLRVSNYKKTVNNDPNEYGFIASVGRNTTVTIKNVTFDGVNIGGADLLEGSKFAVIAGNVSGVLNVENVTIKNSSVGGYQNVGAVVGMASAGSTVNLKNVKFENVQVTGFLKTAKIVGRAGDYNYPDSVTKVIFDENTTGEGITVELNEAAYEADKAATTNWEEFTVGGVASYKIAPYVIYKYNGSVDYQPTVTDKLAWAYSTNFGTYTYDNSSRVISYKPVDDSINNQSESGSTGD